MSNAYKLDYSHRAKASLDRLDRATARRIVIKLEWLAFNAANHPHEALTGNWSGFFRYRVGDYRVVYTLNHTDHVITIEKIGHRREVYD